MKKIIEEFIGGFVIALIVAVCFIFVLYVRGYAATPGTAAYCTPENEIWTLYGTECTTTCYCLCPKCCGTNWNRAVCADGTEPVRYVTVANGKLPFGTEIYIEGVGYRTVHDRGSKVGANHFDIYVGRQNHAYALEWGSQKRRVWIVERGTE